VIIAARPESPQPDLHHEVLEPLSQEAAAELMAVVHPDADRWIPLRSELTELLRRPLFAIRCALDRRQGNPAGVHQAGLVDSVGRQAIADLGDTSQGAFDLLVQLAFCVVDSGGQPIDLRSLEETPVRIAQVMRSRIVHLVDGRASFQLAVLTEWFAAHALLRNPGVLEHSVSSPLRAHRWRYALVQGVLQGSANDVDTIMSTLLIHAPATAAWVHHEAQVPFRQERTTPLAATALEAGARVRRAARAWIEPWPELFERWTFNGEVPTLGVAMNGHHLVTAWNLDRGEATEPVIPLPPHVHPLGPVDYAWTGSMAGRPCSGEGWPWDWTRDHVQRQIDELLENRDLLAAIETCWPELAWDYAHRMLDRSPDVQSEPVLRTDLERVISNLRAHVPEGDAQVRYDRYGWRLGEGELFVADLSRLNIDEIRCCEVSVLTEQIPGLPTALPVVAEHGGIDDHLLERSSARSAAV